MKAVTSYLKEITIPPVYKIKQEFPSNPLTNIEESCHKQIESLGCLKALKPGARIAVAVGSRGVTNISRITASVVAALRQLEFAPYIVSAMASHGRASAEGQQELLAELGITEESVGCPVRASVDVIAIGTLENGLPVYMDKVASQADGIVVINRIKTHTAFHGTYESGLVKMLAIGLGNHIGAKTCHQLGFGQMEKTIIACTKMKLEKCSILFGVAVIEDSCENVSMIEVIEGKQILVREPELLKMAKNNMPSIGIKDIDVLIVDRMGKEISGDGMDPNITGRYATPYATGGPTVGKLAVLSVTEKSHGNVIGIGLADLCTRRLYDEIDFETTYINSLTATVTSVARLPMVLATDYDVIRASILTSNVLDFNTVRFVRIRDTLHLSEMLISESLRDEMASKANVTIVEGPFAMKFHNGMVQEVFS